MSTAMSQSVATPNRTRVTWDVIVIGGGPAGAVTAHQLVVRGLKTLLIDAKSFPREKVCGGYLNPRAVYALQQAGLLASLAGANSITCELEVVTARQRACFPMPSGRVVGRAAFDARLLRAAEAAGATIITGQQAAVEPSPSGETRTVIATSQNSRSAYHTRIVVCADGLSRTSVRRLPEFTVRTVSGSRIGIGAVVHDDSDCWPAARITMAVARHGYVGISRIDRTTLNVAAAVEAARLSHTAPADVAAELLAAANISAPLNLSLANWRGTPPLTSYPQRVASERVFLIGDAAGYVEPFTGEGMAAGLESAMAIAPLLMQAVERWTPLLVGRWQDLHQRIIRDRQTTCKTLSWIVRRGWATSAAMTVCRALPSIAGRMIAYTTQPVPPNSFAVAASL